LQFQQQGKKNFDKFFDKSEIKKIGRSSGFEKRKPNKINAFHFVLGFLLMCSKGKNTFAEWAIQIGFISGSTVSRQGVWDRVQISASQFAEDLLKRFLLLNSGLGKSQGLFSAFGKVLLQDSTVLNLPVVLANVFAGNTSRGKQKSQVRIQTVINVKCMRFLHFSLSGFTSNDQSASGQIMQYARKGDLVIRDLGYFVSQTFEDMLKAEVQFVSRLKYGLLLKTPSGKAIKLSGLLKKRRDKRVNHGEEYYLWLRYSVLITSVGEQVWTPTQIAEVYGVRWQIEIIFKSWKSGAGLNKLLHERVTDANRVKVVIYLFLLFICLFTEKIFNPLKVKIATKRGKELSLIKALNFVMKNLTQVIDSTTNKLWRIMALHCCYDLRTNRRNMADLIDKFKN
jgi:hypothetical protein